MKQDYGIIDSRRKIIFFLQVYLKSSDLGRSVDEVEQLIRKHEAFEKLLASQDEKVKTSTTNILPARIL